MRLRFTAPAALGLAVLTLAAPAGAQTATALDDPSVVGRYQATITPAELAGHLYVYADDYLAGRDTGEPGQRFAALYLAGQYQTMGVAPKGTGADNGNYGVDAYLQPFALERKNLTQLTTTVTRDGETLIASTITPGTTDNLLLVPAFGSVDDASPARLVFVGDGSDFSGVDVADAYALVVPGDGGQAALRQAAGALGAAGARGVILAVAPAAAALQAQADGAFEGGRLSLPSDGDAEAGGLPAVFLTGLDVAEQVMSATDGPSLAPGTAPFDSGLRLAIEADYVTEEVMTENVAAFVEGSDPTLRDEVVVISAHLDHVGTRDAEAGEDTIYNGADDDGSGTASMLEIAEAFQAAKEAGEGPRRSILFLHVTGEEKGLFGSEYYADVEPLVPLESTVANLNIDMIGRYDPERGFETTDYVYIIGGDLISQDLHDWNEAVNETTGTDLFLSDRFNSPDDPNQFFRRSDHWNFGKHEVPFIFYFTGTHADYHGVGDHPDKIDYDRMATIARLIFGTAWEVANRDERPAVSGVGFN